MLFRSLAALPPKWDSVAQMYLQRQNLNQQLTFQNVRLAVVQEFERSGRKIDHTAHKLTAVKRKGPDPSYRPQQQHQPQPGPSRQPQQQQQLGKKKKTKKRGGRLEKEKREKRALRQGENHTEFASSARIQQVVEPMSAPTYINALQPSRAAPLHSTVASFGKNGIEHRKVSLAPAAKKPASPSVWPSLNEAREICNALAVPKTAKNLKPLETPKVSAPIFPHGDPFESYRKVAQKVKKMIDLPVASTSTLPLSRRITTPPFEPLERDLELYDNYEESGFDWGWEHELQCESSREPPVSLGDSEEEDHGFDNMDVDREIADAAGLPAKGKGKQKERQVSDIRTESLLTTLQCTNGSTSSQEKEESLDSSVEYSSVIRL